VQTAETGVILRDQRGKFREGSAPGPGRPPATVDGAFRQLMREVEFIDGEHPVTRAQRLARKAFARAMDDDRKDAVLWARLCIERCDGPARADIADALGFGEIAARECERYLRRDERDVVSPAEFKIADE